MAVVSAFHRFVQFGPEVKCHCGAVNCQGYLGAKRKINLDILVSKKRMLVANLCWGSKQKRSSKIYIAKSAEVAMQLSG